MRPEKRKKNKNFLIILDLIYFVQNNIVSKNINRGSKRLIKTITFLFSLINLFSNNLNLIEERLKGMTYLTMPLILVVMIFQGNHFF